MLCIPLHANENELKFNDVFILKMCLSFQRRQSVIVYFAISLHADGYSVPVALNRLISWPAHMAVLPDV